MPKKASSINHNEIAILDFGSQYTHLIAWRVREPLWTVALHPAGVAVALAIQWNALIRALLGLKAGWKGRAYPATTRP